MSEEHLQKQLKKFDRVIDPIFNRSLLSVFADWKISHHQSNTKRHFGLMSKIKARIGKLIRCFWNLKLPIATLALKQTLDVFELCNPLRDHRYQPLKQKNGSCGHFFEDLLIFTLSIGFMKHTKLRGTRTLVNSGINDFRFPVYSGKLVSPTGYSSHN